MLPHARVNPSPKHNSNPSSKAKFEKRQLPAPYPFRFLPLHGQGGIFVSYIIVCVANGNDTEVAYVIDIQQFVKNNEF